MDWGKIKRTLEERLVELTPEQDAFFRERLIADYDRLIYDIETTMANGVAKSFAMFLTAMDGKLVAAALHTARETALQKIK